MYAGGTCAQGTCAREGGGCVRVEGEREKRRTQTPVSHSSVVQFIILLESAMPVTYYCIHENSIEYVAGEKCELKRWAAADTRGGVISRNPVTRGARVAWFDVNGTVPWCVSTPSGDEGNGEWTFVRVAAYDQRGFRLYTQYPPTFNIVWKGMVPFVAKRMPVFNENELVEARAGYSVCTIDRSAEPDDAVAFYVIPRDGSREQGVDLYCSDFDFGRTESINGVQTRVLGTKLARLAQVHSFVEYSVMRGHTTCADVFPTDEMYIKWWADEEQWYRLMEPCSLIQAESSMVKAAFMAARKKRSLKKWIIPLASEDAELVVTYKKVDYY